MFSAISDVGVTNDVLFLTVRPNGGWKFVTTRSLSYFLLWIDHISVCPALNLNASRKPREFCVYIDCINRVVRKGLEHPYCRSQGKVPEAPRLIHWQNVYVSDALLASVNSEPVIRNRANACFRRYVHTGKEWRTKLLYEMSPNLISHSIPGKKTLGKRHAQIWNPTYGWSSRTRYMHTLIIARSCVEKSMRWL